MEEDKAGTCAGCGAPLKEGASFCTRCGAAVGAATANAAVPPTAAAEQPIPPPAEAVLAETTPPSQAGTMQAETTLPSQMAAAETGAPPPPQAGYEGAAAGFPAPLAAPAPRRGRALLAVGIFGGLLALGAAVFLVLYLTIWRGGEGGVSDPVALAEKYIGALEEGDFDAYIDCLDPEAFPNEGLEDLEDYGFDIDMEEIKKWAREIFEMVEYDFDGVELEEKARSEEKATVVTTAGSMSLSAFGVDQELDLAEDPLEFEMVRKEGRWYITEDPLGDLMRSGLDMDLEDMDFEDMEEMFPEDMRDFMEDFEEMFEEEPAEEEGTT